LLTCQLIGLPAFIESGHLFACAQQRAAVALTDLLIEHCPVAGGAALAIVVELQGGRFCPQNWLPGQRPLRDRKKTLQIVHLRQRFTNTANFVKIGPVDVDNWSDKNH